MRRVGDLVEAQGRAALLAELGEQLALSGVDAQGNLQPYVAEDFGGWKLRREIPVDTGDPDRGGKNRQQHEDAESLECAGDSNHGLCSTRTRGRSTVSRAPPRGSTVSGGGVYAGGVVVGDWGWG